MQAADLDCGLYVATSAAIGRQPVTWLLGSPIRMWFEPLNGVRTALIDAPVNVTDVPILTGGDELWTGRDSATTLVGCAGRCDADDFVGQLTSTAARYHEDAGVITIAAGRRSIVFAPTAAPDPDRSSCDLNAVEVLPCTRYVSTTGAEAGARIEWPRVSPVDVTIHGSGRHRDAVIQIGRTGEVALTVKLTVQPDSIVSSPAEPVHVAPTDTVLADVDALFGQRLVWHPREGSVLLTGPTQTVELDAR